MNKGERNTPGRQMAEHERAPLMLVEAHVDARGAQRPLYLDLADMVHLPEGCYMRDCTKMAGEVMTFAIRHRSERAVSNLPTPSRLPPRKRWIEQLPVARDRPLLGAAATLALVGAAFLLRLVADPLLPSGFPYVTFFPAVIVTSFFFGVRLGSVSALLCGLLAWYVFIPPTYGFALTQGAGFALAFYVFVVATDLALVHWMQAANSQLASERETSRQLAEMREMLFHELQHRVSNNLQVAAALLTMQKRQLTDVDARAAMDEAGARLALVGRISRQLYDPSGAAQPLVPFLAELCRGVIDASGRIDVDLQVLGNQRLRLEPDAAVPTALIVAEAVANAIEHGFGDGRAGRIVVEVERGVEGGLGVMVRNDGSGLPANFDLAASTSLGLRIASTLAQGQSGSFRLEGLEGTTTATLSLPAHLLTSDG
ncbi:sensor histidine kinase [Croceibacterium mercuriale]|uniref:sensor histidine kinase n=1 Tax=Croceibacterium mercuriale TaxID=1572751 RepID=UPI000AA1CE6E|nr:histidine kinase dimerization/phosphoacceptor domain -containing protein [Croceibacterium mercuriale]